MSKRFLISETEKKEILSIYQNKGILVEQNFMALAAPINPLQTARYIKNLTIDDWVNLTSAALDVIPGVGWVASATIDVAHAISYAARYYKSTTDEDKFKNSVSAIFTLGMTVIPVGGNIANIVMNKGINKAITNLTPVVIKKLLGMKVGFNLTKPAWKYCLFTFLLKFSENKIDELLISAKEYLSKISDLSIPGFWDNTVLVNLSVLIGELMEISKEVKNYGNPNYTEINKIIQL